MILIVAELDMQSRRKWHLHPTNIYTLLSIL